MHELLQQLDQLKIELDSYRPIQEERMHRIMQKLRLEWNFNSNSMEGNTLTMTETRKLLYYGITAKGKPLKDHLEMEGHDKALKKLEALIHKDFKITETLIKDFHKLILANSTSLTEKDVEINPGEWKKNWNFLYSPTGEKIEFADPLEVPDLMSTLINWTNNHLYQEDLNRFKKRKYDLHPLLVACIFHKRFIAIHPFGDGNGRMARLLSNLILMQAGFMPAIVPLQSRDDYFHALNDSTLEDVEPLAKYIGLNLIKSMQLAIEGAKGNPVEEPEDWEKELTVLELKIKHRGETPSKSSDLIVNLYEHGLVNFIEQFLEKMKQFDRFFHDKLIEDNGGKLGILADIVMGIGVQKSKSKQEDPVSITFSNPQFEISWKNFKYQGFENFSLHTVMRIEFADLYYAIHYMAPEHQIFKRMYTEPPTEEEQTAIIAAVGKALKEQIEFKLSNK